MRLEEIAVAEVVHTGVGGERAVAQSFIARWLRPAFQNPAAPRQEPLSLSNKELPAHIPQGPVASVEAHFKGRGPWKRGLPLILDTLAALGRV